MVDAVENLFAEIETDLDEIMDAIQMSGLSPPQMRRVIDRVTVYALTMGVAVTDEINGVERGEAPDIGAVRVYAEHVLRCIEANADVEESTRTA